MALNNPKAWAFSISNDDVLATGLWLKRTPETKEDFRINRTRQEAIPDADLAELEDAIRNARSAITETTVNGRTYRIEKWSSPMA